MVWLDQICSKFIIPYCVMEKELSYNKGAMGLDMYMMYGDKNAPVDNRTNTDELIYWRKFNALHRWFVDVLQDGVDNCQLTTVSKDDLTRLIADIRRVIAGEIVDELEPRSGCFFGSLEKDDYYTTQMNKALKDFENLLNGFDFENNNLYYASSW